MHCKVPYSKITQNNWAFLNWKNVFCQNNKMNIVSLRSLLTSWTRNDPKKTPIDETDLPLPEPENLTKNNMSRIEEEWAKEKKKSKPSLFSAFFRANKSCLPRVFIFSLFGFGLKTFMPFVLSGTDSEEFYLRWLKNSISWFISKIKF